MITVARAGSRTPQGFNGYSVMRVTWLGEPPRQVRQWPDQYFDFIYKFDQ